ncbi:MAG TPA: NUDIX domain-containing protein [Actinomycetota bacterium]|nr:NUDIX domain-containing protein [Actinomycetota bacterium]
MPKVSAGLLAYRRTDVGVEILLVHPGGPFWAKKDDGAWSVPKGEYEPSEDPLAVARREFEEEIGQAPPAGSEPVWLGELRQPSGKVVSAWAIEGDLDVREVHSNSFEMEWPPRSGRTAEFPEVDRAGWFGPEEARRKILRGQLGFIDRLEELLAS